MDVRQEEFLTIRKIVILGLMISICLPFSLSADAIITPGRIEATLLPEECIVETIQVTTAEMPVPKLDVIFVIDITGSMNNIIGEVTREVDGITNNIRELVSDAAFALGTLADYPGILNPRDLPWQLAQDFTTDVTLLEQALEDIDLMNGGDNPEAYLRALYETQFLDWREGSRRIVILFGDAPAHDPDPGPDGSLGTADDLTRDDVIAQLAAEDITVLGVYSNASYREFYDAVALGTGGQALNLKNTDQVADIIQELIEGAVTNIGVLTLNVPAEGASWMQWTPSRHIDVLGETQYDFSLDLCVPVDTAPGDYSFEIDVTADGSSLGRVPVLIHVEALPIPPSPWCPLPPLTLGGREWNTCLLLIPIFLLFGLLGLFLLRSRRRPAARGQVYRPETRVGTPTTKRSQPKPNPSRPGAVIQHGKNKPPKRG